MIYTKSVLPNGLTLLSLPLKDRESVSVGIWIKAGSRYEEKHLNGISHFLEHIVFKGTKTRSMKEIKEAVEGKGGSLNAFTGPETTCFFAKVPKAQFRNTFDVLSDIVLNPAFDPKDTEKERRVIIEEIKMVQDNPAQLVEEILDEMIWSNHALGRPLAGSLETVSNIKTEDLLRYKNEYYETSNITISVAGEIDHKHLHSVASSVYPNKKQSNARPLEAFPIDGIKKSFRVINKETEQAHMALAVEGLKKNHPDSYALRILNVILGGNMSSRLFNEIREERGLAYEISSFWKSYYDTGAFVIEAGVDIDKVTDATKAILNECKKLTTESVTPSELNRAKDFFIGQLVISLESSMELMLFAGEEAATSSDIRSIDQMRSSIEKVSAEDIRRLSTQIFKDDKINFAMIGPLSADNQKILESALTFN